MANRTFADYAASLSSGTLDSVIGLEGSTVATAAPGGASYLVYATRLTQITSENVDSGLLAVGAIYTINSYVAGDDFSNVADVLSGSINTDGCVFIATGTTPTDWTNNSSLSKYQNISSTVVLDDSIGTANIEYDYGNNNYVLTIADAFTTDGKTCLFSSSNSASGAYVSGYEIVDESTINFTLNDSSGSVVIEIRVYP